MTAIDVPGIGGGFGDSGAKIYRAMRMEVGSRKTRPASIRSRWVLEVLLHLDHSAQFSAVKKVRRRHRVRVRSGREERRLRMTAWSLEDTRSAGSSAAVVNGRPSTAPQM